MNLAFKNGLRGYKYTEGKKREAADELLAVKLNWLGMQKKCKLSCRSHWKMERLKEQTFSMHVCSDTFEFISKLDQNPVFYT
jgi:hypothetical protein